MTLSPAEEVLAAWREIERHLEAVTPGTADHERLASDAALLRDQYQRLVADLKASDPERSQSLTGSAQPA